MEPITVTLLDSQTILGVKILGIDLGVLGTTQEFISEFFSMFSSSQSDAGQLKGELVDMT